MADKYLLDQVQSLQSQGGDFIVSFGGADATELAQESPVATVCYASCLTMELVCSTFERLDFRTLRYQCLVAEAWTS